MPERRRGRRYLTLKNAAFAVIAIVVAFILLSIWPARSRPSGGLLESPAQSFESPSRGEPVTIVHEGSVARQPEMRPVLVDVPHVPFAVTSMPAVPETNFEPRESQMGEGKQITISGGPEGVAMNVEPPAASTETTGTPAPEPPIR